MDETPGAYEPSRSKLRSPSRVVELSRLTSKQRALANQPWKEYTADGGRKYWYNMESKQSSWEMPEVYKTALAQTATVSKTTAPYISPILLKIYVAYMVIDFNNL